MKKRPKPIRIICIIGFAECAALLMFAMGTAFFASDVILGRSAPAVHLTPETRQELDGLQSIIGILLGLLVGWWTITLVSMIGIWRMRKWGPLLYALLVGASWVVWLNAGLPGLPILDSIMAVVALYYFRDMSWRAIEGNHEAVEQGVEADEA